MPPIRSTDTRRAFLKQAATFPLGAAAAGLPLTVPFPKTFAKRMLRAAAERA